MVTKTTTQEHQHQNAKQRENNNNNNKKMTIGVVMNCAAELKLILIALLILCSVATVVQFFPSRFSISASDLRFCISRLSSSSSTADTTSKLVVLPTKASNTSSSTEKRNNNNNNVSDSSISSNNNNNNNNVASSETDRSISGGNSRRRKEERMKEGGVIERVFNPYGAAAYNFITMGAYRGGVNTFAIIGLSSKPLHRYSKPTYLCQWLPSESTRNNTDATNTSNVTTVGYKILPDWGYGRVYTVVVVNCTFNQPINPDNSGGALLLHASTSGGGDTNLNLTDTFEVLTESPGSLDLSLYEANVNPKYDYLYCGSSLYGNLSPKRVREWIAYHVMFFGPKSHFVIHDAGGVHPEVMEVLRPWMDLGYVTVQDIRDQERFDGYYHNQFMVVNDCLHRYKFAAKWIFFFDVDEYIYVPPKSTIKSVLDSLSGYSQFTIEQMPMSSKLCLASDNHKFYRRWGFEKMVYTDVKKGIRRDRKYAIQPRSVHATGVHMSQDLAGKTTHKTEGKIKYFHYHGSISQRREPCRNLLNVSQINFEDTPYVLDTTLRDIAWSVKKFELKMIGPKLENTRQ